MNSLFDEDLDIIDFGSTNKIEPQKIIQKNRRREAIAIRQDSISKFLEGVKIEEEEQLYLISVDSFGSVELLNYLCNMLTPEEIIITTWSINEDFIDLLKLILSRGIKVKFNCDKSLRGRKSAYYAQVAQLAYTYKDLFKMKTHQLLHAKVTTIKAKEGYYSIESSANYSRNTRIEQFSITNGKQRYEFNKRWIEYIM